MVTPGRNVDGLVERVRGLADGTITAAVPRHAATVLLLRDRPTGPEAYLLRRVKGMSFAGGMHVFPGGSVDPEDAAAEIGWAGPPVSWWADAFSCDEPLARALVCAAVRETFEESGVLLAGTGPDDVLADVSSDAWEAERAALEAREHSLSELLARRGLVLRADLLRPLAHWITPEAEPKRFDTRFFLAELPAGQVCREVGGEADTRLWVRPADALTSGIEMMPPTEASLRDVADAPDVAAALAAPRTVVPVMPQFDVGDDGLVLRVQGNRPGGAGGAAGTGGAGGAAGAGGSDGAAGAGGRPGRRAGARVAVSALRAVTGTASVLLAPNPGPMTLDGTNSWVLRAPGAQTCVVVDPGPLHEGHLTALAACGPVAVVLLTHGHADHSEGAARFAALTGAPVRALDPAHRLGDEGLGEGDVVAAAGLEVRVLATPGHTADSLSFVLDGPGEGAVLTGDTVLGRGTTVVAHPDGVLGDYLASLRRLRELGPATVLPGHGPELPSAGEAADRYLAHREQRLAQVQAAVDGGARTPRNVLEQVYADVDRALWPAAELSVRAQLLHLGVLPAPAGGPGDR